MLEFSRCVQAVDSHTAGEPTRIVTGGIPAIRGGTMAEKRDSLRREHDDLRRALVLEPRGHSAIVLAYLLPPCDPAADLGVVFANDVGYLGMCGHGSIGVATVAAAIGLVSVSEGENRLVLDTPAGSVACRLAVEGGRPRRVAIANVPSFAAHDRIAAPLPGRGKVPAAIAYGGNWFALVEAADLGMALRHEEIPALTAAAMAVREALASQGVRGRDPRTGEESPVDHVKIVEPLPGEERGGRSFTLCPGVAYDRSPCGTGTSAELALLSSRGEIGVGEPYVAESILGTRFCARIAGKCDVAGTEAVIPEIEGSAWITGFSTLAIDPDDPLGHGFGGAP
ncbi:MAG: proline racemase [Planctomycetota bacterium]